MGKICKNMYDVPDMRARSFVLHSIICLPAVLLLLLSTGCTSMPEGDPENGERWFRMNRCNGCHGEKGTGGKGPVIAGLKLSYRQFIRKVRAPDSAIMPAFEADRLSDKDAVEIYLWLQTLTNNNT